MPWLIGDLSHAGAATPKTVAQVPSMRATVIQTNDSSHLHNHHGITASPSAFLCSVIVLDNSFNKFLKEKV